LFYAVGNKNRNASHCVACLQLGGRFYGFLISLRSSALWWQRLKNTLSPNDIKWFFKSKQTHDLYAKQHVQIAYAVNIYVRNMDKYLAIELLLFQRTGACNSQHS